LTVSDDYRLTPGVAFITGADQGNVAGGVVAAAAGVVAAVSEEDIAVGRTEEIASAVVFLAGPGSSFITGQILGVNGGFIT
jgi:NAD(P)-dependent dehydrogenase (short-subunit alcohol dehydrogenase family)